MKRYGRDFRRKPSEFVRTPKYGVTGSGRFRSHRSGVLTFKRLWMPFLEIAFGVYMAMCIAISLIYSFGYGTIFFLLIFSGGYFYVGFSSLHALWKMHREAEMDTAAVVAALAEPIEPVST